MATNPLDSTTPADSASISGGAEHIRDIKAVLNANQPIIDESETAIPDLTARVVALEAVVTGALTCDLAANFTTSAEVPIVWTPRTNTTTITYADGNRTFVLPKVGPYLCNLVYSVQGNTTLGVGVGSMPTVFTYVGSTMQAGSVIQELQLVPSIVDSQTPDIACWLGTITFVAVATLAGQKLTITYAGGGSSMLATRRTPVLTIVPL